MNGTAEHAQLHGGMHGEIEGSRRIVAGGSMIEAVGGISAVVLAILGLTGIFPVDLIAIAVICIGVSLVFEGGTVGARFSRLLAVKGVSEIGYSQLGGGLTAEFFAGVAGMVLGLLSLLGVASSILPPVAMIVFGGALLLGSGATARLSYLEVTNGSAHEGIEQVAQEAVSAAAGAQVLTGLAAGLLGILALVGFTPVILTLVAILCIGTAVVMNGRAVGGRILSLVT